MTESVIPAVWDRVMCAACFQFILLLCFGDVTGGFLCDAWRVKVGGLSDVVYHGRMRWQAVTVKQWLLRLCSADV